MNSSSDEDVDVQDADSCTEAELNQMFKQPLHLGAEEAISLKKSYILHLDVSQYVQPFIHYGNIVFLIQEFLAEISTKWWRQHRRILCIYSI